MIKQNFKFCHIQLGFLSIGWGCPPPHPPDITLTRIVVAYQSNFNVVNKVGDSSIEYNHCHFNKIPIFVQEIVQHLWLQEVNYNYLLCWLWSVQALTSSVSMVHESRAHECDQTQNWTVDWVLAPTHQGPNLSFETIHRLPKKKPESHRGFKRIFLVKTIG